MSSDIKDRFLKRVKYKDKRIESFEADFNRWFGGFSKEEQIVVKTLLESFDYYSLQFINVQLQLLYNRLTDDYHVSDLDAAFTPIKKKNGQFNSSTQYYSDFNRINCINKKSCFDDIKLIDQTIWEKIENLVIVDDICGTGDSLKSFLEFTQRDYSGKTIYYIVIHALEAGENYLREIEEKYNTTIVLITSNCRGKAFELDEVRAIEGAKETIEQFSEDQDINKKYMMGYKDSQGLVAFYNNTPNNTIGLFWCLTDTYTPIFPRMISKEPIWNRRPSINSMKEGRNNRKKANYVLRSKNAGLY